MSDDGQTLVVGAQLGVRTEYMVTRNGRLEPGNRSPSGPAREFANHLSTNYDAYAREFDVLHALKAYAQMTAMAHA